MASPRHHLYLMIFSRSIAYLPGTPALCLWKIKTRNGNQQKEQPAYFFPFFVSLALIFISWSSVRRHITRIPISSAKKRKKKEKKTTKSKKRACYRISPVFFASLTLILFWAPGEAVLELISSAKKKRKKNKTQKSTLSTFLSFLCILDSYLYFIIEH